MGGFGLNERIKWRDLLSRGFVWSVMFGEGAVSYF